MTLMDPRERAIRRSLALHEAVRNVVKEDSSQLDKARARVAKWLETGLVHDDYAQAWRDLLARPFAEICDALVERSERMNDLRQVSPFAGSLTARERWKILREATREAR